LLVYALSPRGMLFGMSSNVMVDHGAEILTRGIE
jgi:hypothetical protein